MIRAFHSIFPALLAACFCLLAPAVAQAYIGPGAGLSAIGSLLALVAAIAVAIFGFLWFPIKSYRRKRRLAREAAAEGSQAIPEDKSAER